MEQIIEKCAILYVDDEYKSLKYFKAAFGNIAPIYTAKNAAEGYRILEKNLGDIGVLIADQRMPGEKGVQMLENVQNLSPDTQRILVTAYSELNTAINAVNCSHIYAYVTKPWDMSNMKDILTQCIDNYWIKKRQLHLFHELDRFKQEIVNQEREDISQHIIGSALHEFKHIVGHFRLLVHALKKKTPAELKEHITALLRRTKKAEYFLQNYLTPSYIEYSFRETDIILFLKRCLSSTVPLKNPNIKVTTRFPSCDGKIKAYIDRDKFQNVIHVIVDNAFDAMKERGELTVTIEKLNDKVIIHFEDTGIGMSKEVLDSIGRPMFTTKEKNGKGFGLFTSLSIIRNHRGRLDIKSEKGAGSIFSIELPAV